MHPKVPGRECGRCSLCCNVLHVIEISKPANTWCEHCLPGKGGCAIYESRPSVCRTFACGWLMSDRVGDEWFPMLSHMVLSLAEMGGVQVCTCTVDPDYDGIWREHPYHAQLHAMAAKGLKAKTPEEILLVQVRVGSRVFLVLEHDDLEITNLNYLLKMRSDGKWDIEVFEDQRDAVKRVVAMIK